VSPCPFVSLSVLDESAASLLKIWMKHYNVAVYDMMMYRLSIDGTISRQIISIAKRGYPYMI